ncbi:MAG: sulfotransferase [Gammaproteobacteria bacterium]
MARAERPIHHITQRLTIDLGPALPELFIAGMGRGGTTWISELFNVGHRYRVMHEPFHARLVPQAAPFSPIDGLHRLTCSAEDDPSDLAFPDLLYVHPDNDEAAYVRAARAILAGRPWINRWVNDLNERVVSRRRIIKDIRTNLMLAWLARLAPTMPIVWVVRHPLSVAGSWTGLSWLPTGDRLKPLSAVLRRFDEVLQVLPEVGAGLARFDRQDRFERAVAAWYLLHAVPQAHLPPGRVFLLPYERLRDEPEATLDKLMAHLPLALDREAMLARIGTPSRTDFRQRAAQGQAQSHGWQGVVSAEQEARCRSLLEQAGMTWYLDDEPPEAGLWGG